MAHRLAACLALSLSIAGASCAEARTPPPLDAVPASAIAEARAVAIRTTGCGDASKTTGTGVVVADGLVVTAAHVVVGATDVLLAASNPDDAVVVRDVSGSVVALDTANDLALISAPTVGLTGSLPDVTLTDFVAGDSARLVGGAASGTIEVEVLRALRINVDEVRSATIIQRDGYELRVEIRRGDSGAGIFDDNGALGAIVFAAPTENSDRAFVVAGAALRSVLNDAWSTHVCDPARSRLVMAAT